MQSQIINFLLDIIWQQAQELQRDGKLEAAFDLYRSILEIDERYLPAFHQMAKIREIQKQFVQAIQIYQQAIEIDKTPPFWIYRHLGYSLRQGGDLEGAIEAYQKALSLQPEDVDTYNLLGQILDRLGDLNGAMDAYQKALELEPENTQIRQLLEVAIAKKEANRIDPIQRAQQLQQEGKLDEALAEYRAILDEDERNLVAVHQVGLICEQQGKWEEAVERYRQAIKVDTEPPFWVYRHLGFALSQQGIFDGAVEAYQKAIELNPKDGNAYALLGQAYERVGNRQDAIEYYKQAIELEREVPLWTYSRLNELLNSIQVKNSQSILDDAPSLNTNRALVDSAYTGSNTRTKSDSDISGALEFLDFLFNGSKEKWDRIYKKIETQDDYFYIQRFFEDRQKDLHSININPIVGVIEACVGNIVEGWAFRWSDFKDTVTLALWIDDIKITEFKCEKFKPTLKKIGLANGRFGFRFTIPDRYLSGKQHQLEIKTLDEKYIIAKQNFKLELKGHLDAIEVGEVAGWIVDINSPNRSLELDVYLNGVKKRSIVANVRRDEIGKIFKFSHLGFSINLETDTFRGTEIVLTLKDSSLSILNTPVNLLNQAAQINTIALLSQLIQKNDVFKDGEKTWLQKFLLPNLKNSARSQIKDVNHLFHESQCSQSVWSKTQIEATINVIIPVYKNFKVTQQCLERVMHCQGNRPYQITVINDCSPEAEIHTYLENLAIAGKINLITHEINQGFPASVNDGMMFDTTSDVVLLNSDAYVTDYWLDRLRDSVYQENNIATGTAFSNNATIFSYPIHYQDIEQIPEDVTLEELAQIFYEVNRNKNIKVPSGHGFCLYIRRDALREVGYFDERTWGKGYGEEVDWCRKALDLGWQHVAATGVFVQHVGSQSFAEEKTELLHKSIHLIRQKYPEYDLEIEAFIKPDPFAEVRRNVDLVRLKRCGDRFILIINHHLGGGTERHIKDMTRILESERINVLILKPDAKSEDWLELTSPKLRSSLLARYQTTQDFPALIQDLQNLGVVHIHIHHTIGFHHHVIEELIDKLDVNYDVTLHDYASICPRVNLSQGEGKYCDEPPVEICELCIQQNEAHENLQQQYEAIGSVKQWLRLSEQFLKGARKIFVPSQDTSNRMIKKFPELEFTVRPHPEFCQTVTLHSQNNRESKVRVGLIGGISHVKGLKTLYDCATYANFIEKDIEFIIIGTTADNHRLEQLPNVTLYGAYKPEELQNLIRNSYLDFAAFLSTWPETYCYTLSEGLENGLYPFAFDIGAIGERIRQLGVGYLTNPDIHFATLLDKFLIFGHQCRHRKKTVELGKNYSNSFLMNYYNLDRSLFQNDV